MRTYDLQQSNGSLFKDLCDSLMGGLSVIVKSGGEDEYTTMKICNCTYDADGDKEEALQKQVFYEFTLSFQLDSSFQILWEVTLRSSSLARILKMKLRWKTSAEY